MKKQGLTNLILKVASVVAAIFSFICLAFKFGAIKAPTPIGTKAIDNFDKWNEMIDKPNDLFKGLGVDVNIDWANVWTAARVFLMIALTLAAICAIIAVVQLFVNNKVLKYVLWAVAGLTVISAVVFFILFTVGGNKLVDSVEVLVKMIPNAKVSVVPYAGSILLLLCPIITAALAVVPTFLKSKKA